jgi:phosphate-selective porin OprO and OprP
MLPETTWMLILPLTLAMAGPQEGGPPEGRPGAPPDSTPLVQSAAPAGADTLPPYRSPEVIRTENFTMTLGSRVQVRYTYVDPAAGDATGSFGIRRARFSLSGDAYDHFRYAIQLELAGASVNLIDANVRYRIAPMATLWFGQGKAHFGRQQLTSSGNLHFVDRTVVDGRFSAGRQAGAALLGQTTGETFEYQVGIYNGTGINAPNDNNRYLTAARAVWTPLGAYAPVESAHDYPSSPRVALGVSALHTTEGTDIEETDVTRFHVEGAFKVQGLNVTSELYREEATPNGDATLRTTGWYAQAGYLLPNRTNEIAARYAVISPDTETNADVIETGVALSHYLRQHRAKIQADLRHVERKILDASDVELRLQLQLTL